jgi:hypothetical protein
MNIPNTVGKFYYLISDLGVHCELKNIGEFEKILNNPSEELKKASWLGYYVIIKKHNGTIKHGLLEKYYR